MPSPSPDWTTVTVQGKYKDFEGNPITGRVIFTPTASRAVDADQLVMIVGRAIAVDIDELTGIVTIDLPATDDPDITPIDFTYTVVEDFDLGLTYSIEVPAATVGVIDLAVVAPDVESSEGYPRYYIETSEARDEAVAAAAIAQANALTWTGAWNAATAYNVSDVATFLGGSYRRLVAGTTAGNPSADATNWEILAAAGEVTLAIGDVRYAMLTGTQTIAGAKTFSSALTASAGITSTTGTFSGIVTANVTSSSAISPQMVVRNDDAAGRPVLQFKKGAVASIVRMDNAGDFQLLTEDGTTFRNLSAGIVTSGGTGFAGPGANITGVVHTTGTETIAGAKTFSTAIIADGPGILQVRPGAVDHAYMGFYARTAAPTTRTGYVGFGAAASNTLHIFNDVSGGEIQFLTTAGTVKANSNVLPTATATYDLGVTGTRWRHLWLSGDVNATGAGAFGGNFAVTGSSVLTGGLTVSAASAVNASLTGTPWALTVTGGNANDGAAIRIGHGSSYPNYIGTLFGLTTYGGMGTVMTDNGLQLTNIGGEFRVQVSAAGTVKTIAYASKSDASKEFVFTTPDADMNSVPPGSQFTVSGVTYTVRSARSTAIRVVESITAAPASGSCVGVLYAPSRMTISTAGGTTFSGNVTATGFTGDGSALTALSGTAITSGTIPVARINGSTNANFVRGDGTYSNVLVNAALANDVSSNMLSFNAGADATLGPLGMQIGFRPSATATSRYVYLSVGDTLGMRYLALNANGAGSFGRVGIGNVAPTEMLDVTGNVKASGTVVGSKLIAGTGSAIVTSLEATASYPAVTVTGTNYYQTAYIAGSVAPISAGVTDSGYRVGLVVQHFFNTAAFAGSLADQYGIWSRVGTNTTAPTGTITNQFGLYIENLDGANVTVTNRYGVYQSHVNARNVFAGPITAGNGVDFSAGKIAVFAANPGGNPTFTTRSAGTKAVYYPTLSGSLVDYAVGVGNSGNLWHSVESVAAGKFEWYGGTTLAATLTGAGVFTLVGALNGTSAVFSGSVSTTGILTSILSGVDPEYRSSGGTHYFQGTTGPVNWAKIQATGIHPGTHNTQDLGLTGTRWKNLYLQGTATIANSVIAGGSITATGAITSSDVVKGGAFQGASSAVTGTSGTVTFDVSLKDVATLTPTAAVTAITMANVPASGTSCEVKLIVTQGATAYTVAMPTGNVVMGAALPTMVANKRYIYTLLTVNGGTTWFVTCDAEV